MLNVVAPGKLVLTLQSIPPFVVESIFVLTLAVLLALPLFFRVQNVLDDSMKRPSKYWPTSAANLRKIKQSHDHVVTHYPVSTFDSASSSSVDLLLESARKTISTPILQASGDNVRTAHRSVLNKAQAAVQEDKEKMETVTKGNDLILKQSSSFVATNSELPIVDISAFDYDAYRYKLVEAALRKQYGDYQPPGDVVLNSIHLNNNDSMVSVRLDDRYHHSIFDFVEECYDATMRMSKRETEYLHPLDHFLVKGTQRPETVEKETETKHVDVTDAAEQDEKSPRISFCDDTALTGSMMRRQDSIIKRNIRSVKSRPSSAGAESTTSKRSTLQRSPTKKSATKFSRTNSSTDSASSKRDTLLGSHRRDDKRETLSSIDGAERESMNCTTISSIDSESVRSESSKLRDDHSCHSRDSSVASKRATSEKPQIQPWLSGSAGGSFNRKYGSGKTPSKMFEATRRSSLMKKVSMLSRQEGSKQSIPQNLECNQTATSVAALDKNPTKDGSKLTIKLDEMKLNSQLGRLEAIKSETEEFQKSDPNSMANLTIGRSPSSSVGYSRRSTTKYSSETSSPRVQVPGTIDSLVQVTQQPPGEPRLAQSLSKGAEGNPEERAGKLPAKQGQPEKLGKVLRDRIQRSRTVSPVLAKQPAPKREFSDTFALSDRLRENVGQDLNRAKNIEKRKEISHDGARTYRGMLGEDVKQTATRDNINKRYTEARMDVQSNSNKIAARMRQSKMDASPCKLKDTVGRKSTNPLDSCRNKEEEKSDFNRKKASSTVRNLGSSSTAKSSLSTVGKLSSASRSLQQRATGSRLNAGLHDNVIGARSMQIRSSKSPASSEKKFSRSGKPEKSEANRPGLKENAPDGLKLPRRDSKAGIAMQAGLKKYIKKLKRVLSDRDNTDIGELASLSLTDAILPDLESTLSSVEVQQVQNLLSMAEKKSELMQKNLDEIKGNVI